MSRNEHFDVGRSEHEWVHGTDWYHGTSVPGLKELASSPSSVRYGAMGYGHTSPNFATTDPLEAAGYATDAADADERRGIEGRRPVVYHVRPTSDHFDPDPHGGPMGYHDGPQDMNEAREHHENGIPVAMRFHDRMHVLEEIPEERWRDRLEH